MTSPQPSDTQHASEWIDRIIDLIYAQRYSEGDKSCAGAGADSDGVARFLPINKLLSGLNFLAHTMPGTVTSKGDLPMPRPIFEFNQDQGRILSWTILGPGRKRRAELWLGVRVYEANKEICCRFAWDHSQYTGHESQLTEEELKLKKQIDASITEEPDQRVYLGDPRLQREFIACIAERLLNYCKRQLDNGPPTHGGKRIGAGAPPKKPCSNAGLERIKELVEHYGGKLTKKAIEDAKNELGASETDIRRWWATERKRELRARVNDAKNRRKTPAKNFLPRQNLIV